MTRREKKQIKEISTVNLEGDDILLDEDDFVLDETEELEDLDLLEDEFLDEDIQGIVDGTIGVDGAE